jgi:hypothetical protein
VLCYCSGPVSAYFLGQYNESCIYSVSRDCLGGKENHFWPLHTEKKDHDFRLGEGLGAVLDEDGL